MPVFLRAASAELLAVNEDMDGQEEHDGNGNRPVQDQNKGILIQNHAKQAACEGNYDQPQKKPSLCTQLLPVDDGMDDAQQEKMTDASLCRWMPVRGTMTVTIKLMSSARLRNFFICLQSPDLREWF